MGGVKSPVTYKRSVKVRSGMPRGNEQSINLHIEMHFLVVSGVFSFVVLFVCFLFCFVVFCCCCCFLLVFLVVSC